MFPGGGATTFMNNTLSGPNGVVQTPKYNLINFQGVNAEVPKDCGYAGMASGNNYTLVYGKVTGNDGGAVDSGRGSDASVDARSGGGTGGSGTVSDGGSADRRSTDAAADRATGSGGSGGAGAGGAAGTAGVSGGSGGSTGTGGRLVVDAGETQSDGSGARSSDAGADGGCSCSAAPGSDTPAVAALGATWLLALAVRRRPRRVGRARPVD
jgi:MYXO-CTERM domain-containing protein